MHHDHDQDQDDQLADEPVGWQRSAACHGMTDLFFPARGDSLATAREVCNACPVRDLCAEHALDRGEKFGIWGALSEAERRVMRRDRRRTRRPA